LVHAQTEAFGFPKTWDAAIRVNKPGSRIANIGYHGENPKPLEVPLEPFGMGMADKQIYGGLCSGGSERLHHIFRLMQTGKVAPTLMTTHEFGLDGIETAFATMQNKEDGIIKP
jgi:isopropanol dehydrogenase (NADP+)